MTVASYKVISLTTKFIIPTSQNQLEKLKMRVIGLALFPLVCLSALIGNISLGARADDDCLGYTVVARKQSKPLATS